MADLNNKVLPLSIPSNTSENFNSNPLSVYMKEAESSNKSTQLLLPPKPNNFRDQKIQIQNNYNIQNGMNMTNNIDSQNINNNQLDQNDQSNEIETLKNKTQEFFKRYKMENQDSRSSHNQRVSSASRTSNISGDFLLNNKTSNNQNPLIIPSGSSPTPPREPSFIKMATNNTPGQSIPQISNNGLQKNTINFKNKFLEATQSTSQIGQILPQPPQNQMHGTNPQYHLRQPSGDQTPKRNISQENSSIVNNLQMQMIPKDTNFQIENQPNLQGYKLKEFAPIFQTSNIISNTKMLEMLMYNNSIALKQLFG